jgi:hypothetical protein
MRYSDHMVCPHCGDTSRVLKVETDKHHTARRHRECPNGHSFLTFEVHGNAITPNHRRLRTYAETLTKRVARWRRDQQIALDFAAHGWRQASEKWDLCKNAVYLAVQRAKNYSGVRRNVLSDCENAD